MFLGEVVGTAVLILLGDGVVAGVLLNKSKAQNAGWIVITFAWGFASSLECSASVAVTGGVAHLNPAVTIGLAAMSATRSTWSDVPQLIAGQFLGAAIGATLVWLAYLRALAGDGRPGPQAGGLLDGAGDPQHGREPDHGDHRHVHAGRSASSPLAARVGGRDSVALRRRAARLW